MVLIDAKRAQSEGGKGKGSSRSWQAALSTCELEMVNPNVLIMHAREAGMDEVELQNAQGCVPEGGQATVVGGDSADC